MCVKLTPERDDADSFVIGQLSLLLVKYPIVDSLFDLCRLLPYARHIQSDFELSCTTVSMQRYKTP